MALSASTFSGIGGAVDSLFGAIGDQAAASGFKRAAAYQDKAALFAEQEAALSARSTFIQQTQLDRQIYKTLGGQIADIAGAGFTDSGSALYLMRDSAQQAALSKQLLQTQGQITESGYHAAASGYRAEADAYRSQATAKNSSASGGFLSSALSIGATIFSFFSDRRLKENIVFLREQNGHRIYSYNFIGSDTVREGVMADEVQKTMPEAVEPDALGYLKVRYDMIGLEALVANG